MLQNKAQIAPESIYNPRASRALKRAMDPGREFAFPKPFSYGAIFSPQLIHQGDLDRE